MEYTIEKLKSDFENAQSLEDKQQVLIDMIDEVSSDFINEHKETLQQYRNELQEIHNKMKQEDHESITKKIESGEIQLYTCTKSVKSYKEGQNYYVYVMDGPSVVLNFIVNDGELKSKRLVYDFDFNEHFTKL